MSTNTQGPQWTAITATLHPRAPVSSLCQPLQPGHGRQVTSGDLVILGIKQIINIPFQEGTWRPQKVRFRSPLQPNSHHFLSAHFQPVDRPQNQSKKYTNGTCIFKISLNYSFYHQIVSLNQLFTRV